MANVLNKTTLQYLTSVNTPDYPTEYWLINPDLSSVDGYVEQKYWTIVDGYVEEMTQEQKDGVDAALLAQIIPEKVYQVITFTNAKKDKISSEAWYATDNGDGTYSDKAEETTYAYSERNLVGRTVKTFYYGGAEASSEVFDYYTNGPKTIVKKK